MKTDTQYLEPVGFKGTPGEWYVMADEIASRNYRVAIVFTASEAEKKFWHHNLRLMRQSKELAKALQECVNELKLLKKTVKSELIKDEYIQPTIDNAEQVLKDAGLSDK